MTTLRRALLLLPLLAACSPKDPATTTDGAIDTTTADPASTSTTAATSTGEPTASTSSAGSTGEPDPTNNTTIDELPPCSWHWPEFEGLVFCPPLADMNADIGGTTPYGQISLRYAHFGLFLCAECPKAEEGALRLYVDPPDLGEPTGDYLAFEWVTLGGLDPGFWSGQAGVIGGQVVEALPNKLTLTDTVIPPLDQTSPPLDEAAPPVLSGTLSLTGNGWDVHGSFSAPLCTELDWILPCE